MNPRHAAPAEGMAVLLIWATGLLALALLAGIAWYLQPLNPGVLALQFAFTPRAFGAVVHFWSTEQLYRFRAHLGADGVLLLCYGCFGYLLASRTHLFGALRPDLRRWILWALPVAAVLDAAENGLHWWLTAAPRFGVAWPYLLAACCACGKWLLLFGFALVAILATAARARDPA